MENLEELTNLAQAVDKILKEELATAGLVSDVAEARIYTEKRVGIKGDKRIWGYCAEITLKDKEGCLFPDREFLARLSTRITNEIYIMVGVEYTIAMKD